MTAVTTNVNRNIDIRDTDRLPDVTTVCFSRRRVGSEYDVLHRRKL